jgi:hypothetical protein
VSQKFLNLTKPEQRTILLKMQNDLNLRAEILEKDIWLCWTLNTLFKLPLNMAFKGGTSLSKCFGDDLIQRFSEDLDITIDYNDLDNNIDLAQNYSRSALKKISKKLLNSLQNCTQNKILPYIQKQFATDFPSDKIKIEINENREIIKIYYPSTLQAKTEYLKNYIMLEFGGRNIITPNNQQQITAILSSHFKNLKFPSANVTVLSPIRTFWEKATLIHVECNRDRLLNTPERLSRHWYDLVKLSNSWVGKQAIQSIDILHDVIKHKKAFFYSSYANYDKCLAGQFKLIPKTSEIASLKSDYQKMRQANMFYGNPPEFETIMNELRKLEITINNL